jgi:hypothetical protein
MSTRREKMIDLINQWHLDWLDWPTEGSPSLGEHLFARLGLELENHPNTPVSVPAYDDEGNPVMDERLVQPVQRHRFEWVTKQRWVTPWEEVGERETSQELSDRLEESRQRWSGREPGGEDA